MILAVLLLVLPLIQGRALGWPGWCVAMLAAAAPVFGLFAGALPQRGGDCCRLGRCLACG